MQDSLNSILQLVQINPNSEMEAKMKRSSTFLFLLVVLVLVTLACGSDITVSDTPGVAPSRNDKGPLLIQATDEMLLLEEAGILSDFAREEGGVPVQLFTEKGSVELKLEIESISEDNPSRVHTYITADPFFMPGTEVRDKKPLMMSLTTLVVDRGKATELGWTADLSMADVIAATESKRLSLCSASASQDATALNFYLAALTALKGTGETIRLSDLSGNTVIVSRMKIFYDALKRSRFSSEEMRQSVLSERKEGQVVCGAVVLPEGAAIALNRDLTAAGLEPMQVFYVTDATSVQIYTIGCVDGVTPQKATQCLALEEYLQSASVQAKIVSLGFRASDVGYAVSNADPKVFNPDWGVRMDEPLTVDMPKDEVVKAAVTLYQVGLRPGFYTCFVLDFSPSMDGSGKRQLLTAMKILLDQSLAAHHELLASPKDTVCTVLFSGKVLNEDILGNIKPEYFVTGNDGGQLLSLYGLVEKQRFGSSTNVYGSALRGLEIVFQQARDDQLQAVILLTDGEHNTGPGPSDFEREYAWFKGIPVFAIGMGSADERSLQWIADLTGGDYCDGRGGEEQLARCFREFRESSN